MPADSGLPVPTGKFPALLSFTADSGALYAVTTTRVSRLHKNNIRWITPSDTGADTLHIQILAKKDSYLFAGTYDHGVFVSLRQWCVVVCRRQWDRRDECSNACRGRGERYFLPEPIRKVYFVPQITAHTGLPSIADLSNHR